MGYANVIVKVNDNHHMHNVDTSFNGWRWSIVLVCSDGKKSMMGSDRIGWMFCGGSISLIQIPVRPVRPVRLPYHKTPPVFLPVLNVECCNKVVIIQRVDA